MTMRCVHAIIDAVEKQRVLHILSVFTALVIQHVKCMHHIAPNFTLFVYVIS